MHLNRRHILTLTSAVAFGTLAGPGMAAGKLRVVTTTGMIADAARALGGDLVQVKALMGPGVDPHGYRQTRSDIVALTRADLVLRHGLYLEAQMEDFLNRLATRETVVGVAEVLTPQELLTYPGHSDRFDPHVWMVPALWMKPIMAVRDALIASLPEARSEIDANTARYLERLRALQGYAEATLATVPAEARVLITAHDAFGYFGRAFGFEVVGIQGVSTESEAGLNRIGELVELLVNRRIGAAFVESSVSDRSIRALIEGAAARGRIVALGGELFSDAMGPEGTYEGSYIGMIDHNATTIARALGGSVPDRGMSGRLAAAS